MEASGVDERFRLVLESQARRAVLVARFYGLLTFRDLIEIAPQVHGHRDFPDVSGVLFDMREADTGFDSLELRRFVDLLAERSEPRGYRAAYLVGNDLSFGMTRMFESLAEGLHDRERMVFRDEPAAYSWLAGP